MWIAVLGGTFSVITLLLKTAIDMGSKTSRARKALAADLDLLSKVPADMAGWAGPEDLRERIHRKMLEYAVSDLASATSSTSRAAAAPGSEQAGWRRDIPYDLLVAAAAVVTAVLGSGVVSWIADEMTQLDGALVNALAAVLAAVLGSVTAILFTQWRKRRRRPSLEQWRAAHAEATSR